MGGDGDDDAYISSLKLNSNYYSQRTVLTKLERCIKKESVISLSVRVYVYVYTCLLVDNGTWNMISRFMSPK